MRLLLRLIWMHIGLSYMGKTSKKISRKKYAGLKEVRFMDFENCQILLFLMQEGNKVLTFQKYRACEEGVPESLPSPIFGFPVSAYIW